MHEGLSTRPLFCNPILMHLPIFLGRDAFRDYHTVDQLLIIPAPEDGEMHRIHWKPEMLNQPIYQKADGKIDTASTYCARLRALATRAGYTAFSNHYFRRECLFNIGKIRLSRELNVD